MIRYVSGAKQRIHASILILADKRLSFLLRSSCWIELRCNIYTSLKQTYQESLVWTCQESSVLYSDPWASLLTTWTIVTTWSTVTYVNTPWPEPWTMCFLLPPYLSIVTHLTWKFFPVVFAAEEYIWSVGIWCQMLMHGMAERSSSGPLWMGALNWSYWKGRKEST